MQVQKTTDHLPLLEISLAVEIARVEQGKTLGITAAKQEDVSWHNLIVGQMDEVADLDVLPRYLCVAIDFPEIITGFFG